MDEDTWFSAAEAKDGSFIDVVDPVKSGVKPHVQPKSQIKFDQRIPESQFATAQESIDTLVASLTSEPKPEPKSGSYMKFEEWVKAEFGLIVASLTADQRKKLQAKFDARNQPPAPAPIPAPTPTPPNNDGGADPVNDLLAARAAAARREVDIRALCGTNVELVAQALENGWEDDRIQTEVRLADLEAANETTGDDGFQMPQFNIQVSEGVTANHADVMEAAVSMSLINDERALLDPFNDMDEDHTQAYGRRDVQPIPEQVLDAAYNRYRGNIGLQTLAADCCRFDQVQGSTPHWAGLDTLQASFTSTTLPHVFDTVVRRLLLRNFKRLPLKWRQIASTDRVKDFREREQFRVYGTGAWEKITPDGEIKHGQMVEGPGYKNKLDTFGQVNQLTREEFINDDLGALSAIARQMTDYGLLAPEFLFWETLLGAEASGFFSTGANSNNNLISGTAFGLDGLRAIWDCWCENVEQGIPKDKGKKPIFLDFEPRTLLVPSCMKIDVDLFLGTANFAATGGGGTAELVSTRNPFFNSFNVVDSNYLSNTNFHSGASKTAFYLFTDPQVVSAIELVFLNGVQRPTIQRITPEPTKLGFGFRGYIDVGASMQDPRAACKSKGV